jgi:hypothetical protein
VHRLDGASSYHWLSNPALSSQANPDARLPLFFLLFATARVLLRRRLGRMVLFLVFGGTVWLSFVWLSFVVLGLVGLGLVGLSLVMLGLVVVGLGLVGLGLVMLSLVGLAFGLLSFVGLGLLVFALGRLRFVMLAFSLWRFVVFTCLDLGRIVRLPVISRVALVRVMTSLLLMHTLTICGRDMLPVRRRLFLGGRSGVDSPGAVEAHVVVDGRMVDHGTINISIVDNRRIHSPDRGIIVKGVTLPSAAIETRPKIAETIVDTAVESNVGTPIAAVPAIVASVKRPVTRCPKESRSRRFNPDARNPKITVLPVGPVAGRPNISILRTVWLLVDGERRRRNGNQDRLSEKRGCYAQQTCQQHISGSS